MVYDWTPVPITTVRIVGRGMYGPVFELLGLAAVACYHIGYWGVTHDIQMWLGQGRVIEYRVL